MASYSYGQFRNSLRFHGFVLVRDNDHEWWRKVTNEGNVYQVPVSHKFHDTIPKNLFSKMLRQAHLTEEEFRQGL